MYLCMFLLPASLSGFPVSQTSPQLMHLRALLKGSPLQTTNAQLLLNISKSPDV